MSRLALGIAKRHVRLAVRRNLMKRIIREWFRLNQNDLPANDLMFVATPQVNRITTRSDLRAHLVSALESVVADLQKDRI